MSDACMHDQQKSDAVSKNLSGMFVVFLISVFAAAVTNLRARRLKSALTNLIRVVVRPASHMVQVQIPTYNIRHKPVNVHCGNLKASLVCVPSDILAKD
jgi:hypothetical protein